MIDLTELYAILRRAAAAREIIAYSDLSIRYRETTGEDHHHHGTWDVPLGELNGHTNRIGLPPISAIVTYRVDEEDLDSAFVPPGDNFWATPGVPERPRTADDREMIWLGLVNRVHHARWPEELPGL
jgi:hypothetical protein